MEGRGTSEEKKKKTSFGFSSSHDKIKLIDVLSEDDDFLVASPFCNSLQASFSETANEHAGFRLSGFGNPPEVEIIRQKEDNPLSPDFVQPSRPSFLRRSLAWDTAFLESPGVLDHDELSFINKGFTLDVRKRRPDSGSTTNSDDNSFNWFEIEPSIYTPESHKVLNVANRSTESGLKQENNVQACKNFDKSSINKIKSDQTSTGKSINVQKTELTAGRRRGTLSSPKPPKALAKTTTISNNRDLSGTTTGSGRASIMKKKTASQSSSALNSSIVSTAAISLTLSVSSIDTSTDSSSARASDFSGSFSTSKTWRSHAERSGRTEYISRSNCSLSLSTHPCHPSLTGSKIGLERKKTFREPFLLHNDAKERSHLQSNLNSPVSSSQAIVGTCSVGLLSEKVSRLRPPSPQMRFFDENTPPRYQWATRGRNMPQNVVTEVPKNTKRPKSDLTNTMSLLTTDKRMCLETRRVGDSGKRPRHKLGQNSILEEEKRREILKSKRCREKSRGRKEAIGIHNEVVNATKNAADQENGKKDLSCSGDQIGNLTRYLEAIDLNQEKTIESEKRQINWQSKDNIKHQQLDSSSASSKPCRLAPAWISTMRTPLSDKTSTCNFIGTFALPMEPKKEKLVQKGSSVASEVSNKENS